MDRITLAGLSLVGASMAGLLTSDIVATAHASRPGGKAYLLAVSTGEQLRLVGASGVAADNLVNVGSAPNGGRLMVCNTVVDLASVSFGYSCRKS